MNVSPAQADVRQQSDSVERQGESKLRFVFFDGASIFFHSSHTTSATHGKYGGERGAY